MDHDPTDSGTGALFAAHTAARVVDFAYRIFIVRLAGAGPVGALAVVGSLYGLLVTLASAGVPAAVTNLTAEKLSHGDRVGLNRTLSLAFLITGGLGTLFAAGLMASHDLAACLLFHDPALGLPLLILAPAVAAVPVSGVYRAYLQGRYLTYPTARARLVEALAQTACGLSLLMLAGPLPLAAATAVLAGAITVGELAGLASVYRSFHRASSIPGRPPSPAEPSPAEEQVGNESHAQAATLRGDLEAMSRFAWSSTSVRLVAMASGTISATMIPALLRASGTSASEALAQYGQLGGMAGQLAFFPATLVWAFTFNLTPALSAYRTKANTRAACVMVEKCLCQAWLLALPAAVCSFLLAGPLCQFAFGTGDPALLLAILAATAPLITIDQVMTASLHGWSEPGLAFRNFACGEVINLGLTYLLVPRIGLPGAALAIFVGTLIEALWDWLTLARLLHRRPSLRRPAGQAGLPAALAGITAYTVHHVLLSPLGNSLATALALAVAFLPVLIWARLQRTAP